MILTLIIKRQCLKDLINKLLTDDFNFDFNKAYLRITIYDVLEWKLVDEHYSITINNLHINRFLHKDNIDKFVIEQFK